MEQLVERIKISEEAILKAHTNTWNALKDALDEQGWGGFVSTHEVYGKLSEEMKEMLDAIHASKNFVSQNTRNELLDIALTAIFAIACIDEETMDS